MKSAPAVLVLIIFIVGIFAVINGTDSTVSSTGDAIKLSKSLKIPSKVSSPKMSKSSGTSGDSFSDDSYDLRELIESTSEKCNGFCLMLNGCNLGLFDTVENPESLTVELMDIWYGDSSPSLEDSEDQYSFYVYFNFMLDGARYEHKFLASNYYGPNKLSCAVSAKKDVWDPYYTTTFDIESATKFGSNKLYTYMHSIYDLTPYGYTSDNFGTYEDAYLSTKFSVGAITNDLLNFFNEDLYDDDTLLMVEPFIESLKVSVGEVKYEISASEAASYMGVPSGVTEPLSLFPYTIAIEDFIDSATVTVPRIDFTYVERSYNPELIFHTSFIDDGRFTGELVHESSMQYTSGPFDYTIDVELEVPDGCYSDPALFATCEAVKETLKSATTITKEDECTVDNTVVTTIEHSVSATGFRIDDSSGAESTPKVSGLCEREEYTGDIEGSFATTWDTQLPDVYNEQLDYLLQKALYSYHLDNPYETKRSAAFSNAELDGFAYCYETTPLKTTTSYDGPNNLFVHGNLITCDLTVDSGEIWSAVSGGKHTQTFHVDYINDLLHNSNLAASYTDSGVTCRVDHPSKPVLAMMTNNMLPEDYKDYRGERLTISYPATLVTCDDDSFWVNGFTSNYHGLTTSYSIDDRMHWTIPFGYSTSHTDYSEEFLDHMLNQLLTVPVKNVLSEMASPASSYYSDTTSCNMVANKYAVRSSCYW